MQPQSPQSDDGGAPRPRPGPPSGGGKWDDYRNIDMDLHQVLTTAERSPDIGPPNKEMIDVARGWLADDSRNKLVVSCGGFKEYGKPFEQRVAKWLAQQGIDTRRVTYETKPRTLAVIDDHGLEYIKGNGPEMLKEILNRSHNLDNQGPNVLSHSGQPAPDEQATLPPETRKTDGQASRGQPLRR